MSELRVRIPVNDTVGNVSGIWNIPTDADWLYVFAHGAGAGMEHAFMSAFAGRLADAGVATLRYQFPYMERGGGPPDRKPTLLGTVNAVAEFARSEWGGRVFAGGKSMGGRMTSMAQAMSPLAGVEGLMFLGFPLHPPKRPGTSRAEHLAGVGIPMLFLQGSRDALAGLDLLEPVIEELGEVAGLHLLEGADHGFATRKMDGRTAEEVLSEAVEVCVAWLADL